LVVFREEGGSFRDIVSGGKFTARGKVLVTEQDSSIDLGPDTAVTVEVGNWIFEGRLGDDPKFVEGRSKSVRFNLPGGGSLSLALSSKALTWSVTAQTGFDKDGQSLEVSPVAESLYAEESAPITPADAVFAGVTIAVDRATATAAVPLMGSVKHLVKNMGSGDAAEEFGLCTVKVKGLATLERE
jgi:hypothetical protein